MNKYVDYFVVVVSNTTFTGLALKLVFHLFNHIFNSIDKKLYFIIYHFHLIVKEHGAEKNIKEIKLVMLLNH